MSQYIARWGEYVVAWRNLTYGEYRKFKPRYESSPFQEPMEIALDIYSLVRIEGPTPQFISAGILSFICKQQMLNNPFSGKYEDIETAIDMARRVVTGDYLLSAKALIAATLNYKPEEIDSWDANTFFIRLAQTEVANGRTFDPVNPNVLKDSKGNPVAPKIKKSLSSTQQKALDRVRSQSKG